MAGRYGGRFGTNQEQEQRRIQKEPVVVWKKDWVLPAGASTNSTVKILKWVRTGQVITFDQEEEVGEETMAMDVDSSLLVEQPHPDSAEDSLAVTPAPPPLVDITTSEAPLVTHLSNEETPLPEESSTLAEQTSTNLVEEEPSAPIADGEPSLPEDLDMQTSLDSSQPILTQASVVDSQDHSNSAAEIETSQPISE